MGKRKKNKPDPLIARLEDALGLGYFISYSDSSEYVSDLEVLQDELDVMVDKGKAAKAVPLFELFLSGCYEKAEEIDDSLGGFGMFLESLFASWIVARQESGMDPEETVEQILNWVETDNYGFFYKAENTVITALGKREYAFLKGHFETLLVEARETHGEVSKPLEWLKFCYTIKKELQPYLDLCEQFKIDPEDCENVARLYRSKRKPEQALDWVERGLKLREQQVWRNPGYGLEKLREELLQKLGRGDEAFQLAWDAFQNSPSEYSYQDFMKYVSTKERKSWHEKAMAITAKADLRSFIGLCAKTKEWNALAVRIEKASHQALENLSHYTSKPIAQRFEKTHPFLAAKLYRALGMRIVDSKKSKYYSAAIEHFRKAKDLYTKHGKPRQWSAIVTKVRKEHFRKYGIMGDFEDLVEGGKPEEPESFETRLRKKWPKKK